MLASARGTEREREGEGGKKRGRGRSEGGDQACSKYRRTTFIFCALIIHLAPALVRLFLPRSQIKAEMDAPRRNRDLPNPPLFPPCETSRTAIGRLLHRENRPTIPPLFLEYIIYRCFSRLFYQDRGESVFFRFLGNPSPPGFYRGRKGGSRKGRSSNGRFVMKGY